MPFITNSGEKSLGSRIRELIEKAEVLKFLTGFFYFSGIKEFYETLKRLENEASLNKGFLKILVGMNVDEGINGLYEYTRDAKIYNQNEFKKAFLDSLKKAFNSKDLDKKEIYEQIEFFIKLLEEGKLILRKTKKPNHSKLYLFKLQETGAPSLFITGSSNLTRPGLESQEEFNVEIKDYGFKEAEEYFDKLWDDAIEFTSKDIKAIINLLKKETFLREINPFEAWAYLLKIYLDLHTGANEKEKVKNSAGWEGEIEAEFLKPVIKSLKEIKSLIVDIAKLQYCVFFTQKKITKENPGAYNFVQFGEKTKYNKKPTCSTRSYWYILPEITGEFLFNVSSGDRYFIPLNNKKFL